MKLGLFATIAGAAMFSFTPLALAADNFTVSVTSNGATATQGFVSAEQALGQLKSQQLNVLLPSYTTTSIASAAINYRGVAATASYLTTGTALTFTIPSLGIKEVFTGTTRNDSQQQLLNWSQKNNAYSRVLAALVASSPTEPLAGNPSSLMSRMISGDFAVAFGANAQGTASQRGGEIGVGLAYGHMTQGGAAVDSITLPLSYSWRFEADPRYVLTVDMPISYNSAAGAAGAAVSMGVALSIPLADNWTITPKIGTGATGSVDLASAGALVGGSVTSAYRFKAMDMDFVLGNMVGVVKSIPLSFGQYSFDPNLTNGYTKNGIMLSRPLRLMNVQSEYFAAAEAQFWIMDTRFVGSKLYDDSYQEIGMAIGKPVAAFGRFVRFGVSYLHSHHSNGATANFGYTF